MCDVQKDVQYTLTKQQLQGYWETKFGEVWTSKCESCLFIPIFPYSVFVLYKIVPTKYALVNDIQLCCENCVKNGIYTTSYDATRINVWLAHFGPIYTEKCFCCYKNVLNFFDSWHISHFIARSKGGSDKISNLRPVCGQCNLTMKCLSIEEFQLRNNFEANMETKLLLKVENETKNAIITSEKSIEHLKDLINAARKTKLEERSKQLVQFLFDTCEIEEYTENVEFKCKVLKANLVTVFKDYCDKQNIKVKRFSYAYYNHVFSKMGIKESTGNDGIVFHGIELKPFLKTWLEIQKNSS